MNTPNRPRSGIVPPDVMATTRASRRPAISPVTRSQVSRGLSSANSSDGIGAGEHAEHALERLAGQRLERRRAPDDRVELVDRPAVQDRHRDELLGQDVERVARQGRRLDRPGVHPLHDDRALEQVAAVLREEDAPRRRADLVAGPADPLEPARDRARRLDLDDEVDGAHVDARARGCSSRRARAAGRP